MAGIISCAMNFWAPERFPTFFQHKRDNSLPTHTRHTCVVPQTNSLPQTVLRKLRVTRNILHYTTLTSKKPDQTSPVSFENQTNVTISIKQIPQHRSLEIFLNLETFSKKSLCVVQSLTWWRNGCWVQLFFRRFSGVTCWWKSFSYLQPEHNCNRISSFRVHDSIGKF